MIDLPIVFYCVYQQIHLLLINKIDLLTKAQVI